MSPGAPFFYGTNYDIHPLGSRDRAQFEKLATAAASVRAPREIGDALASRWHGSFSQRSTLTLHTSRRQNRREPLQGGPDDVVAWRKPPSRELDRRALRGALGRAEIAPQNPRHNLKAAREEIHNESPPTSLEEREA